MREEGSRFGGWGRGTLASSSVPGSGWLPAPCRQTYRTAEDVLGKEAKPSLRLVLLYSPSLPEDSELLGPASNVPDGGGARQIPVRGADVWSLLPGCEEPEPLLQAGGRYLLLPPSSFFGGGRVVLGSGSYGPRAY